MRTKEKKEKKQKRLSKCIEYDPLPPERINMPPISIALVRDRSMRLREKGPQSTEAGLHVFPSVSPRENTIGKGKLAFPLGLR